MNVGDSVVITRGPRKGKTGVIDKVVSHDPFVGTIYDVRVEDRGTWCYYETQLVLVEDSEMEARA